MLCRARYQNKFKNKLPINILSTLGFVSKPSGTSNRISSRFYFEWVPFRRDYKGDTNALGATHIYLWPAKNNGGRLSAVVNAVFMHRAKREGDRERFPAYLCVFMSIAFKYSQRLAMYEYFVRWLLLPCGFIPFFRCLMLSHLHCTVVLSGLFSTRGFVKWNNLTAQYLSL